MLPQMASALSSRQTALNAFESQSLGAAEKSYGQIGQGIEEMAKSCSGCQQTQKQLPPAPVHSWSGPPLPGKGVM